MDQPSFGPEGQPNRQPSLPNEGVDRGFHQWAGEGSRVVEGLSNDEDFLERRSCRLSSINPEHHPDLVRPQPVREDGEPPPKAVPPPAYGRPVRVDAAS